MIDWDQTPRLLMEHCEGPHGGTSVEVYALDLPNDVRMWLCKSCWVKSWRRHGGPAQTAIRGSRITILAPTVHEGGTDGAAI